MFWTINTGNLHSRSMAYCRKMGFFLVGVCPMGSKLLCLESLKFGASWPKGFFVDERETTYGAFCLPILHGSS
jgi:hypothetical protein